MKCASCDYEHSSVVETRYNELNNINKRRRECLKCGLRFTTYETVKQNQHQTKPPHKILPP